MKKKKKINDKINDVPMDNKVSIGSISHTLRAIELSMQMLTYKIMKKVHLNPKSVMYLQE